MIWRIIFLTLKMSWFDTASMASPKASPARPTQWPPGLVWLHQWTREELQMSLVWTSVKPQRCTLGWSVTLLFATKLLSQAEVKFYPLKALLGLKSSTDTECIGWEALYASNFAINTISKNQCCIQLRADQIKVYKQTIHYTLQQLFLCQVSY